MLEPQLLILSMGTNDCYSTRFQMADFTESLEQMLMLIKEILPKTKILLTTPPPASSAKPLRTMSSQDAGRKHRKKVTTMTYRFNESAARVSEEIMRRAELYGVAAFDLFSAMGGQSGINSWIADG